MCDGSHLCPLPSTETRNTHAVPKLGLFVGQTVNNSVVRVELAGDEVEILRVPRVIAPEHRVSDVVGELDDPRRTRVHEERRVRQVPDHSPLRAEGSKLDGHPLKCRLVGALVEDDKAPLSVPAAGKTLKIQVESAAKVLERDFHRIPIRIRCFADDTGKGAGGVVRIRQDPQDGFEDTPGFIPGEAFPGFASPGEDLLGVELDPVGVSGVDALRQLVHSAGDPVCLCLEHRYSPEDEVFLVGVPGGA